MSFKMIVSHTIIDFLSAALNLDLFFFLLDVPDKARMPNVLHRGEAAPASKNLAPLIQNL